MTEEKHRIRTETAGFYLLKNMNSHRMGRTVGPGRNTEYSGTTMSKPNGRNEVTMSRTNGRTMEERGDRRRSQEDRQNGSASQNGLPRAQSAAGLYTGIFRRQ